jgi:hypothetical protein
VTGEAVQKRPDAWRWACGRCGTFGPWEDRKYLAASGKALHDVDEHGGALRDLER